jgi:crotonobetainyl-CoA:carnitine CoA-transferase CaiB-like acyl-CoA transferase
MMPIHREDPSTIPSGGAAMLSHLLVLDATDGGAALGAQMLGDLGAEVVLLEPPAGVASRALAPFCDDVPGPERSLEFFSLHRGKQSVVVDLDDAAERDRLTRLVESADVLLDDGRRGWLARAGFDAPKLAALRPELVHVSITAFGEIGPKSGWAATDLTANASSMAMWVTGDSDRAPLACSIPQAFRHAGAEAAAAALIALRERKRSGLGQHIDVSAQTAMMIATQSQLLSHGWRDHQFTRVAGGLKIAGKRLRFVYACADGYVNLTFLFGRPIGLGTARFFEWMYEEGGCDEALKNEDWVGYGAKLLGGKLVEREHEAVMETIERFTRTKTKAELYAAAFARNLYLVPLSDGMDLLRSKQLAEREFWQPLAHPALGREVVYPGPFVKLSRTPIRYRRPPPRLGEHGETCLPEARTSSASADRATATPRPDGAAALSGLRVLDFSWVYAGPAVTRELADYGATVIRLESSSAPDALRASGPYKDGQGGWERSANYANVNVGKHNVGLNLRAEGAREVALRLIDWADVVVENFSPKGMKGLGLDYETLRERKPELIMLSSCLSGQTGPERTLAGYGTMGAALAGFGYVTGWPDRAPAAPFVAYTDYVSPRFALAALLAALDHRDRTGEGQHIDCSQAECSIHNLGPAALEPGVNGRAMVARGNASLHHAPSGVYPVRGDDRWVALAAPDQASWLALCEVAACGWQDDARFASPALRLRSFEALDELISRWTATHEVDELEQALQARGVPVHRISQSADLFSDPQLAARRHFVALDHPELGPMPYEASRVVFSRTPSVLTRGAATLGQDNGWVLGDLLGFSEEEISELVIAGAIE